MADVFRSRDSQADFDRVGGCLSYDFYLEPGLDVPRCNLYSSTVAYALHSIDDNEPHLWFDLGCGDPLAPQWSAVDSLGPAARRRRARLGV